MKSFLNGFVVALVFWGVVGLFLITTEVLK